jgi:hypothetical protein
MNSSSVFDYPKYSIPKAIDTEYDILNDTIDSQIGFYLINF